MSISTFVRAPSATLRPPTLPVTPFPATAAKSLASTGGEIQAEAVGWALYRRNGMTAWVGLRARFRGGEAPTRTAELVAEFEEGVWGDYGIGVGWFAFAGSYDPVDDVSSGTLTFDLVVP